MSPLEQAVEQLLVKVRKLPSVKFIQKKAIPYGVALQFQLGKEKNNLNVYHSAKKGLSLVLGGKKSTSLAAALQKICGLKQEVTEQRHNWEKWAGTDESGKGDFFGPLVVAGFVAEKAILQRLQEQGVDDCKKVDDKNIAKIAAFLYREFPSHCKVLALSPKNYNKVYSQFRAKGQKLNQLMVWLHTKATLELKNQIDFQGVVIDKFASQSTLTTYAPREFSQIPCIFREKAEDDVAVAAASILARAEFLKQMDFLSEKCGFPLHKGASSLVKKDARKFIAKFSAEKLPFVCKTHFKTYEEVLSTTSQQGNK